MCFCARPCVARVRVMKRLPEGSQISLASSSPGAQLSPLAPESSLAMELGFGFWGWQGAVVK